MVDNSLFNDNSAVFGGAIYSISPEIINSRFNGCKALELGNDVFAINKSTIVNSNVLSENLYENNLTDSIIMAASGKIIYNGYDYDVFAAESNIISPNGRTNDLYIADSSLKLLRNVVDSSDCSEYLKLILYNYSNNQLSRSEAVAMIRNGVYGNSPVPTEKAPVFEFVGNSVIVYDYISFITPSSNTNYYSVKKTNYILNQSITKVALNKTAFVGDIVEFSINFTNGNNFTLPDVFVKDVFDENEFEYLSFKSNDNWTYNSTSKIFTLSSLNSHNTSNLVLSFKVKTNATLNNTVYGGFKGSITCNNTTSIKTFNPVLNVEKSCLTPNVFLTQTAKFNITVKNNGDIDLHDIVLTEDNSKDLLFEGFYDYGLWDYSLINKKHTWKLLNPLAPGHASSLLVYFNTNASGRLINNVSVESSQTKGKFTAQDSVDVSRPEIKVEKIAVNPDVVLSDPAVFKIIVNNTSPVDLTGVSVCEDSYDGLVYDSFRASDSWIHSIIAGKHVWTFKENLLPGEVISFFTVFNTTGNGTFVNNVVASSDTSSSTQANATVNVLVPKFSVEKVALTPSVFLGSQAVYKIVINNTGETNLTNIVVEEYPDSFLVYDHFSDNGLFTHSIVNEKHVWNLNRLAKGDYAEFSVYFNTTASGRLVNNVSVESSQTKGKFTAQASVDVIRPEIKVEKIAVNPDVVLSESAVFEIIDNNTSPVTLTGVSVCEDSYDGLVYDSFRASDKWNHSIIAGKHVWTFKENLVPGEVISFFTLFNTTSNGTFVNNVVASSDTSSSARANATVNVLMPKFSVKKLALMQNVVLTSQALYQIVIHNTGETDLTNIVVEEYPDSSLVYDHFTDNGVFTHSIVNEKHVWTLNKLAKGAYAEFSVYFNTTASGHILNNVSVETSQTKGKSTAQASVDVFRPEIKVEKIAVNPDVVLSKPAVFEIIVNNTSPVTLTGVSVCEDSYDGLVYDSFRASDKWNHSIIAGKHVWTFTENLLPGEVISFFTVFNTYRNGTFVNNVVVSSDTSSSAQVNATVNVLVPKLSVEKVALMQSVSLGSQAVYEIVLHNAGETDLTNIVVEEYPDSSLVYDHFTDNGLFTHSIINEKHVWTLNKLTKGAYAGFLVYFNTTAAGNVTNRISVRSDEIKDTNASNTTNVLLPSFTVEKICLIPNVLVGNQTLFEVVIKNTGKVELTNVYFTEESFDGLIFDSAIGEAIWTHSIVKGKNTWTLNEPLKGDAYIGLILKFNTTAAGNYTNIISAASNQTGVLIANATVHVFENKVPDPPEQNSSNNYSMEVFKIAVTPSVVLNDQITFQIIIHNTGKFNLNNVKVTELIPEGLIYSHFVDYLNIWTYNGDLTWSSNSSIYPGEYVGFYVTFNTTKDGVFTNIVNVAANNTNDSSSNASFNVLKPDFTVEKILVEDNILNGNQATFEIVVHNTGNAPLTGVTVSEYDFKGLVYDHFTDYLDIWTYNGDLTWTMNTELLAGEYVALFVTFNTTDEGNFTNIVAADSNECEEKFSNATVRVFNENIDISMICLTPLVIVGNQAIFEITIQNTGKIPISVLKLSEFDFDGLIYDHYIDYLGEWINDGLTWTLNTTLVPREVTSLFVVFNTTKEGNFTNIVLANKDIFNTNRLLSANALEEGIYVSAPVEVVKPVYVIEKVTINRTVMVGEEVMFEIIVHNTCKVNIDNVTVRDIPSDALSYVRFIDNEGRWVKNGDLSWNLTKALVPGEYSSFFVVFNAAKAGVFLNSIESGNLTSNASVEVEEIARPEYTIDKVTINRTVNIGENVIFEIIVHNTGKINIHNIVVRDIAGVGLDYVSFIDDEGCWIKNSDLSWNLTESLVPGEYSSFFVVFNAGKAGVLENVIESGNLTSSAYVEVEEIPKP